MYNQELQTNNNNLQEVLNTINLLPEGNFPNGKKWTKSNSINTCSTIKYADGLWVASSINVGIYYSTNGKDWTLGNNTYQRVYSIEYADGVWVASDEKLKVIIYSTDGKEWLQSNIT